MTKVNIISGFLGAGKTTFIKKMLKEAFAGQKVVLIENEFGEIGIDGGFLKDAGIQVSEMNSGCICCSLVGDFGKALEEVLTTYEPDRILIEPSGVGKLSDVIQAVARVAEHNELVIESVVTVVDGKKCKMYLKNFGEFFANQVEAAQLIIMSRTQDMTEEKLKESVELLRTQNQEASIITTAWDQISGDKILNAMEGLAAMKEQLLEETKHGHHDHDHDHDHDHECCHGHHDHDHDHDHECCHGHHDHDHDHNHEHYHEHHHEHGEDCTCGCHDHDHHGHHHADDVFTSWGTETPATYDKQEIETILRTLSESDEYGVILRAKGMVAGQDGNWIYFDMVPGEYEVRQGEADYTGRICVIGTGLKVEALGQLFHA